MWSFFVIYFKVLCHLSHPEPEPVSLSFDPQAGLSYYLSYQLGRREVMLRNFQVKSIKGCSFCISSACLPLELSQHAMRGLKPHDNMHELRANSLFLD